MKLLNFLDSNSLNDNIDTLHPYANADNNFKYLYCFGLAVLAYGHIDTINELEKVFNELLESINLSTSSKNKLITDINENFDYKMNEVIKAFDTKDKQYLFIEDLYKLNMKTLISQKYSENVIDAFISLFKLTLDEVIFLKDFIRFAKNSDLAKAKNLYYDFLKKGYTVSYSLIKYVYPSFSIQEHYEKIELINGESIILDSNIIINGDINITNGSSLFIKGAELVVYGSIFIDNAKICIENSKIFVQDCSKEILIDIGSSAFVTINNTRINCNYKCGAISQKKGCLFINNTKFINNKFERAINFFGNTINIENSQFINCINGGIGIFKEANLKVNDCIFENCNSEHGGAIYSNTLYNCDISNSIFRNCMAKFLGAAVYFEYKKYGQNLIKCKFENCRPIESKIFNFYKNRNEVQEYDN